MDDLLKSNTTNRKWLVDRVRAEVVGPDPVGEPFDFSVEKVQFSGWEDFRKPRVQLNGEEVLWQDPPIKRFGAGILFPRQQTEAIQLDEESKTELEDPYGESSVNEGELDLSDLDSEYSGSAEAMHEEEHVALANAFKPAAMGLSFLADIRQLDKGFYVILGCCHAVTPRERIDVTSAKYVKKKVEVKSPNGTNKVAERDFWLRRPLTDSEGKLLSVLVEFDLETTSKQIQRLWLPGLENQVEVVAVIRPDPGVNPNKDSRLITVSLINSCDESLGHLNELSIFQSGIRICSDRDSSWIIPYTALENDGDEDAEIRRNRLMFRGAKSFAVGHGVAANWPGEQPDKVSEVWTELLPSFETPTTSADLRDAEGHSISVSMRKLALLDQSEDGRDEIETLVKAYGQWIEEQKSAIERESDQIDVEIALENVQSCEMCLHRLEAGYEFLFSSETEAEDARLAFRLTNHAMLIAQLRSSREVRKAIWNQGHYTFSTGHPVVDETVPNENIGYWRAFQIAFLLMTIPDVCVSNSYNRSTVDLIWFPTGGGKTEAYLGLSAFTIFYNRLRGKESGTDVLMRYTLRLLTAQQFQRAGLLFCAMDYLRRTSIESKRLGEKPITLGMWVGRTATPNKREAARAALKKLQRDDQAENPFILLKCPWCHAQFGPIRTEDSRKRRKAPESVLGYKIHQSPGKPGTVVFKCPDPDCDYGVDPRNPGKPSIPISIIDDDIYDEPPEMLIGTVDKFALLAWEPRARAFFGFDRSGRRSKMPPSLIIQDELHLISGPLGSVMGAFETVIEELCKVESNGTSVLPKIVASTATISRAEDQVRSLYARTEVRLFPPPGIDVGDSFFSTELRQDDGTLAPGRLYLGIFGSGYSSQQTAQARIFAALMQWGILIPGGESETIDPWYTLLAFFNSLRELGGAATLLASDTRDYLRVILDRHSIDYSKIRQLFSVTELTGRIRSDRIPLSIQELERPCSYDSNGRLGGAIEACLASSIIEVGVDIDRLALMTITGQPKTTSQYIQVSGRVGRSATRPGLIVVVYSQGKPRDRSHYEQFRTYHQKLYAHVEPTSVTPFCPPTVDRVLHSLITSLVRQTGDELIANSPRPFPLAEETELRQKIYDMVLERVHTVDSTELAYVEAMLMRRLREWEYWNPSDYGSFGSAPPNAPLMHPAGSTVPPSWQEHSWPTLSSMRDVDASCEAEVTQFYNTAHAGEPL